MKVEDQIRRSLEFEAGRQDDGNPMGAERVMLIGSRRRTRKLVAVPVAATIALAGLVWMTSTVAPERDVVGTGTSVPAATTSIPTSATTDSAQSADASQSAEDAARDGIVPAIAAMTYAQRVNQYPEDFGVTSVDTTEGRWVVSVPYAGTSNATPCEVGDTSGVYGQDWICKTEYAEVLLLDSDSETILRAYPFPSVSPQQIEVTADAVYCMRQGDGGLPDSMLCRIERSTGELTVRVFPFVTGSDQIDPDDYAWLPSSWTVAEPTPLALWSELVVGDGTLTVTGESGSAWIDPLTLELLGGDPTQPISGEMVQVAFSRSGSSDCSVVGFTDRIVPQGVDPILGAFQHLAGGPTPAETADGLGSWFSDATEGFVLSATLSDGLLIVDFDDIRPHMGGASTSCGSASLIAQLNATAFRFPAVERVSYTIEGSCDAFFNWLQGDCQTFER